MKNGKTTVRELFDGDKIFSVPKYQRAYAWEEKNLVEFLDDIKNQVSTKSYFFGTFLLHNKGLKDDYERVDIVDGQQRLTTFSIFSKVLLQQLRQLGSKLATDKAVRNFIRNDDGYKIEVSNNDNQFLHAYILGDKPCSNSLMETPSQKRLFAAKRFFEERLKQFEKKDLERFYEKSTNAEVLLYVVQDISSATQIFELMNDRGRKLTDLESIKSFLMYMVGMALKNSDQAINDIQDGFASIYRTVEAHDINASDVLRYHTIAFEECTVEDYDNPKEYIKKKILKALKSENDVFVKEHALDYVTRLSESFRIFANIKSNADKLSSIDELQMIGRVAPFYPLMMKIKKEDPSKLDGLVQEICRFTFRAALVGLKSNGESYLYRCIRENGDVTSKVMDFVRENWWNINVRAKEVVGYDNYYEWVSTNVIKYILFKYENSLRKAAGHHLLTPKEFFNTNEREKFNIEHIHAQRAKNLVLTNDFKENYLHSIGNLVIDSTASNSSKGNKATESKQLAFATAPLMSQNELTADKVKWGSLICVKKYIRVRDAKLKKFIRCEWGI